MEPRCVSTGLRRPRIEVAERGGDGASREAHATFRTVDKAKVVSVGGEPEPGLFAEVGQGARLFRAEKEFVRAETTCGDDNPIRRDDLRSCAPRFFLVALHVATAIALLLYFRDDWIKIIRGFIRTLRTRKLETTDERMAWLLIIGDPKI